MDFKKEGKLLYKDWVGQKGYTLAVEKYTRLTKEERKELIKWFIGARRERMNTTLGEIYAARTMLKDFLGEERI